ncbi:MAG: LppM family (lipo)protein, partial [Acidimicrobiia bacterium]
PTFGDDAVAISRTDGDMTYVGVASTVDDISNFEQNSAELGTFSSFSYEFDDSGATLNATLSAQDVGELGGEGFGDLGIDPAELTEDFFSANVVVTMPGEVTEHNADAVRSDGTLVWKVPFTGSTQISAASTFGSSAANWTLIILIGLLLIGVIAVVAAIVISRRQSQSAVDEAAASHTAASAAAVEGDVQVSEGDVPASADDTLVDESVAVAEGAADEGTPGDSPQDGSAEDAEVDSPESTDDQPENT